METPQRGLDIGPREAVPSHGKIARQPGNDVAISGHNMVNGVQVSGITAEIISGKADQGAGPISGQQIAARPDASERFVFMMMPLASCGIDRGSG